MEKPPSVASFSFQFQLAIFAIRYYIKGSHKNNNNKLDVSIGGEGQMYNGRTEERFAVGW